MAGVLKIEIKHPTGHSPKLNPIGQSEQGEERLTDDITDNHNVNVTLPKLGIRRAKRKAPKMMNSRFLNGVQEVEMEAGSLSFQAQRFRSSTLAAKRAETRKRPGDARGPMGLSVNYSSRSQTEEPSADKTKRFILSGKIKLPPLAKSLPDIHQLTSMVSPTSSMSQRERLHMEIEVLEAMRGVRRRGELLPHREPMNLRMGGSRMELQERLDVSDEIARLKSILLPTKAKDLYVGRGFKLPPKHALNKPRGKKSSLSIFLPPQKESNGAAGLRHSSFSVWQSMKSRKLPDVSLLPALFANPLPNALKYLVPLNPGAAKESAMKIPSGDKASPKVVPPPPPGTREGDLLTQNMNGLESAAVAEMPSGPLAGFHYREVTSEERLASLRQTFMKLETELTGPLTFVQVKDEMLADITETTQEAFLQQVFDTYKTSDNFSFDEFASFAYLTQCISSLSGSCKEAFGKIDPAHSASAIAKYLAVFEAAASSPRGLGSVASIETRLTSESLPNLTEESSRELHSVLTQQGDDLNQLLFIAIIPYLMTLETDSLPAIAN